MLLIIVPGAVDYLLQPPFSWDSQEFSKILKMQWTACICQFPCTQSVFQYVCMHVCMTFSVCLQCMHACMHLYQFPCMQCIHEVFSMHACMHLCQFACIQCMHAQFRRHGKNNLSEYWLDQTRPRVQNVSP